MSGLIDGKNLKIRAIVEQFAGKNVQGTKDHTSHKNRHIRKRMKPLNYFESALLPKLVNHSVVTYTYFIFSVYIQYIYSVYIYPVCNNLTRKIKQLLGIMEKAVNILGGRQTPHSCE